VYLTPAGCDVSLVIEAVTRAMRTDRVTELAAALAETARRGALDDPGLFPPPSAGGYARRSIWRDPQGRYVVLGMTWAPGQGSPLHDHGGLFGAEIVVSGLMRERSFRLVDRDPDGRHLFTPERETLHGRGSIGTLIPPLEYHEFGNAGGEVAHTVHVYAGDLDRCTVFEREAGGWWRPSSIGLRCDG